MLLNLKQAILSIYLVLNRMALAHTYTKVFRLKRELPDFSRSSGKSENLLHSTNQQRLLTGKIE